MTRIVRPFWLLLPLFAGCAGVPTRVESRASPVAARGVVFVVDGAGGYQTAPRSLAAVVDEMSLPLHVRSFDWTHGRGRALADEMDFAHARCQGRLLAEEICAYRRSFPAVPISVVAFSAGSFVALTAAEALPPNTLERIVLLAPAVSAGYDLRPSLASARQGVDVFTSERDWFYLGIGTTIVGTPDRRRDAAAGRFGFRPPCLLPGEEWLANRLRQHPWDPCVAWTGNDGDHGGTLEPAYLKAYVLPLLFTSPSAAR